MISTPNQMAFDFEDTHNKLSWNISLKFGGRRLLLGRVILSSAIAASSAMTFAANKPAVHLSKQDSEIQKFKDCTINLRLSHDKKKIIGDGIAIPIPNGAIISDDNLYASIRVRGKFLGFQMEKYRLCRQ